MARSTYVARETDEGRILRELWVLYEETTDADGNAAACLVQVDDEAMGWEGVEGELDEEQRAAIEAEIGLPLLEERYCRNRETGAPMRVCYKRHGRRDWIGGKGYVYTRVVSVWNPKATPGRGSWEEAAEAAAPGEQFGFVLTEAEFAAFTKAAGELTPEERRAASQARCMEREAARAALTADAGTERVCRFVKRTDGSLRRMRFRYDPSRRANFDAEAKGLLPVYDLDKQAARFVNLDGVLR